MRQEKFNIILWTLKKSRQLRGVSQADMGRLIGCNQSQYAKKEKGLQSFTLEELLAVCEFLGYELKTLERNRSSDQPGVEIVSPGAEGHLFGYLCL